jgi:hypothetical protein
MPFATRLVPCLPLDGVGDERAQQVGPRGRCAIEAAKRPDASARTSTGVRTDGSRSYCVTTAGVTPVGLEPEAVRQEVLAAAAAGEDPPELDRVDFEGLASVAANKMSTRRAGES